MDTIIIKIFGKEKFRIRDTTQWVPESRARTYADLTPSERASLHQYLRHSVHKPKRTAYYQPKVELFEELSKDRSSLVYTLKITFSVPKLLFGSSLFEANEATKEQVLKALLTALARTSIEISSEVIEKAYVSGVHFSKNILLPPEIRMQDLLIELSRLDINKTVDITQKNFKHGGKSLQLFTGTREHVFYEKIADATRPKVKRNDKGEVGKERNFVERLGLEGREVFRYEYRLKHGQSVSYDINLLLGRNTKLPVLFEDLFAPDLCKTIIQKSWRKLLNQPQNKLALIDTGSKLGLLAHIITEARKDSTVHSLNRALTSYGLISAIQEHGAKEVRRVVFGSYNEDHSERLTKRFEVAAELTQGLPYTNNIALIDAAIDRYQLMTRLSLTLAV